MLDWSDDAQRLLANGFHPGLALVTTDYVSALFRRWPNPRANEEMAVAIGLADPQPVSEPRLVAASARAQQLFIRFRAPALRARKWRREGRQAPFMVDFDWLPEDGTEDGSRWAHCCMLDLLERAAAVPKPSHEAFRPKIPARARRQLLDRSQPRRRRARRAIAGGSRPPRMPFAATRPRAPHVRHLLRLARRREERFRKLALTCLFAALREEFAWAERLPDLSATQRRDWSLRGGLADAADGPKDALDLCSRFLRASADAHAIGLAARLDASGGDPSGFPQTPPGARRL